MFLENQSLLRFNTFGIRATARFLALVDSESELRQLLLSVTARNLPLVVLGGGSNVVLAGNVSGLVLVPRMKGIRLLEQHPDHVLVECAAGENWHDFVFYCLSHHWFGIENLSLIPGTVGAAPVQNIGAYGVEVADYLDSVAAFSRTDGTMRWFKRSECAFGYRDSIFKQAEKDRWVITRVRFRLSRRPEIKAGYGDIQRHLQSMGKVHPQPSDVAQAVIAIRRSKLPDPAQIGNAGSFFKNPVVSAEIHHRLQQAFPSLVAFPQAEGFKLAAGWLIEQAGWKGRVWGGAGVFAKQALVLINHDQATGAEVLSLAKAIRDDVFRLFGVHLEMEPEIIGACD